MTWLTIQHVTGPKYDIRPKGNYQDVYKDLREQLQEEMYQQHARCVCLRSSNFSSAPSSFAWLMDTISTLPHLMELDLSVLGSNVYRSVPVSALIQAVRNATKLQGLYLNHDFRLDTPESIHELGQVMQQHASLAKVTLIRCHRPHIRVLIRYMAKMPHLRELILHWAPVEWEDRGILNRHGEVMAWHILSQLLTATSLPSSSLWAPSLQHLTLASMNKRDQETMQGAVDMIKSLGNPSTTTNTGTMEHDDQPRQPSSSLTHLTLRVCHFQFFHVAVIDAVANMLPYNRSLVSLTVQLQIRSGVQVWLPVVRSLAHNACLKEFRLYKYSIVGYGTRRAPEPFAGCVSNEFLQAAIQVFRDYCNTTLEYFLFDSWKVIDVEMDLYLLANQSGRRRLLLGLDGPNNNNNGNNNDNHEQHRNRQPTLQDWIEALIATKEHVHVTFYWLSNNPALVEASMGRRVLGA